MAADFKSEHEEWRLGIEPGERHESHSSSVPAAVRREAAHERLERPVMLITVERLYWAIIALYAVASRCAMLGTRPLGPIEARNALAAYQTMHVGAMPAPPAAWLQLLNAGVFGAFGASDLTARLLFAISGIAMILIAFAFRRAIGRSGALAMATLLALSPSIAYFSRSAATQIPALLAALAVLAFLARIHRRASGATAMVLGIAIGLMLSADAQNLMVAAGFALGLAIVGIWRLAVSDEPWLGTRIWWERYSSLLFLATVFATITAVAAESGFFSRPPLAALTAALRSNWIARDGAAPMLAPFMASFAFYEFLIVVAAAAGAIAALSNLGGARSPLAVFVLIWTIAAAAFFMMTPAAAPAWVVEILVPASALGAVGIEALARTRGWNLVFYPLAALGLATFYVQIAANFVIIAPNPAEAPWTRHALLFWSQPATASGAADALRQAAAGPPPMKTVWIADDSTVLRWYLRGLDPAESVAGADLIAGASEAPSGWPIGGRATFDLESWWHPDLRGLRLRDALRFLLIGRSWRGLETREITVLTRAVHPVPTTIYMPAPPSAPPAVTPATAPAVTPNAIVAGGQASSSPTAAPQPTR